MIAEDDLTSIGEGDWSFIGDFTTVGVKGGGRTLSTDGGSIRTDGFSITDMLSRGQTGFLLELRGGDLVVNDL